MGMKTTSEPSDALDRHQLRRDSGLPTVSVLSGPVGLALQQGRLWAERHGRPIVEVADDRLDAIADSWADRLAASGNLRRWVVCRLAQRLGENADDLGGRIARMSPGELGLFLDASSPDRDREGVEAISGWILRATANGKEIASPGLANRLGVALSGGTGIEPFERAMVALGALIPPGSSPVILAARRSDGVEGPKWVEAIARSLAGLVLSQPRLTAILATDPDVLGAYIRLAPESREKALIRSGVVAVPGLDGDEIGRRLAVAIPGVTSGREGTIRRLADDGASTGLVDLFLDVALATATSESDGPVVVDRARSAAERFLFERLETLPTTAGLFELNTTLDIPFGPGRVMEVDLGSHVLKLAIEVDGYYHFQGEDSYRRDRRKDFLLQSRGYLVVRILAEDVVRRLEDILDLILEAVASCRRDRKEPNRDAFP
jgi:Protein of unknown function (DUF559)